MRARWFMWLAAGVLAALAGGCATGGEDESELPWNMSQSWESSPGLPGGLMNPY